MARLGDPFPLVGGRRSPLRRWVIIFLLLAGLGGIAWVAHRPIQQVYWAVYARVKPMVSETDLIRLGKTLPVAATPAKSRELDETAQQEAPADAALEEALPAVVLATEDPAPATAAGAAGIVEWAGAGAGAEAGGAEAAPVAAEDAPAGGAVAGGGDAAPAAAGSSLAEKHKLTKEMVQKVAKGETVVVTWANYHYKDFVLNWVHHIKASGCTAFIVGAMDDELLSELVALGVPTFAMSSGLTTGDFGWGSPTFHKMGREKINLIATFTQMGFTILVSDVDTVWLRDPIPYVQKYPEADILTSSDHLANTVDDEGLENWPHAGSAANIGMMLFRPSAAKLAEEWVRVLEADSSVWDQNAFNDLFRRGNEGSSRPDRLFKGYDGTLMIGIFPVALFCSGHTYFTQRMPDKLGLKPYVAHATFQFSGTPGKRHRMRERFLWKDGPEYFALGGGFLAYEADVPQAMLDATASVAKDGTLEATLPHFTLVNHQLRQLRGAVALAGALGRAVVLPELWCGMDRWWAPHSGIIPGSNQHLPYLCEADHVLDLESWDRPMPEDVYGPSVPYREYSFLQKQEAAPLNASVLTIEVCAEESAADCADGSGPAAEAGGVVKLRPGLDDAQLKAALATVAKPFKLVMVKGGMGRLSKGHAVAADHTKFKMRLDLYTSIWCCINAHPGHIWYDFFWDLIPHKDRHNREIGEAWKPQTGP